MRERSTNYNIEGHQYGVPAIVEENIQKQASKVATKARRPDVAEDLKQEARTCAWQDAADGEDNPRYLLANTSQAISDVMRKGTDVDGKLWPHYERAHVWEILSTDYPADEKGTPFGELILDEKASVEEQALGVIMVEGVARRLTAEERVILAERLAGYYQREIAENLELKDRYAVRRRLRRIREKTAEYLEREDFG